MYLTRRLVCFLGVVGMAGLAAAQGPPDTIEPVLLTINPVSEVPRIDGELEDPAWQTGVWTWEFWTATGQLPGSQRTEASVVYSATELFAAFRCYEEWMNEIVATLRDRDGRVWEDDCVEVFIDRNLDGETYHHLIVNTLGIQFDEIVNDVRWNASWRVAIGQSEQFWSVELAIPFADLGGAPQPGEVWGINLNRERRPKEEFYSWSFTGPTFHVPKRFGRGVFLAKPVNMMVLNTGDLFLGRDQLYLKVSSSDELAWVARTVAHGENDLHTEDIVLRVAGSEREKVFGVPYEITESGEGFLELVVSHATKDAVRLRRIYPYVIPQAEDRLQEAEVYQIRAEAAAGLLASGSPAHLTVLERLTDFADRLTALRESFAQPEELGRKGWEAQEDRCDALVRDYRLLILQAHAAAAFTDGESLPPYAVSHASCMRKVFPDVVPDPDISREVEISLARGEHEGIQLILVPFTESLAGLEVSTETPQWVGESIPGASVETTLFEVGLVETQAPVYPVDRVGWWPDPLTPLGTLSVEPGEARAVWVDIYAPESVPAGDYHGAIKIQPRDAASLRLELKVHVWDFTLPRRSSLTTAFAFSETAVQTYYGMEEVPPELRRTYYDFLLDHRINPTDLYSGDPRPRGEDIPFCLERGLSAFNACHIQQQEKWEETELAELRRRITEVYSYLKAEQLIPLAYVYAFDEPMPKDYDALRKILAMVHDAAPKLRRVTSGPPVEALFGSVDVWVPNLEEFRLSAAQARQEAGEEVWWHVGSRPVHPYPNFFVDYAGIDHRIVPWMNWEYGSTGLLYYSINWGWMNNLQGNRQWPEVPWNTQTSGHYNGDGQLIYPGPDGRPWSSIRLELIRDGIEDYEYFSMLKQRVEQAGEDAAAKAAAGLLDIPPEVVESTLSYTDDPEVLLRYRQQIAEAIESLAASR